MLKMKVDKITKPGNLGQAIEKVVKEKSDMGSITDKTEEVEIKLKAMAKSENAK